MDLEKKLEELNQKYRELLRGGKTDEATSVVQKARRIKREGSIEDEQEESEEEKEKSDESEKEEQEESSENEEEKEEPKEEGRKSEFERIKGVASELAVELSEDFESIEDLSKANESDLEPIPGIGKIKARKILKRAKRLAG